MLSLHQFLHPSVLLGADRNRAASVNQSGFNSGLANRGLLCRLDGSFPYGPCNVLEGVQSSPSVLTRGEQRLSQAPAIQLELQQLLLSALEGPGSICRLLPKVAASGNALKSSCLFIPTKLLQKFQPAAGEQRSEMQDHPPRVQVSLPGTQGGGSR